jgi:HD superfamily phosphohydrolase
MDDTGPQQLPFAGDSDSDGEKQVGEVGKLYQDPLYGAKVLSPLAVEIIDTPEFQRLSGLKQLGFSDLVYRGAQHSRFEHSIGTYFITRTMMRRIEQNHERLGLPHPGSDASPLFRHVPPNAGVDSSITTPHAKWRGLTEVLSIAALLHDVGHVPYGHTLEDEFSGLYKRHDSLAGPRFWDLLFNPSSSLNAVFSAEKPWVGKLPNEKLQRLIYVVLSWKETIEPPSGFEKVLNRELASVEKGLRVKRLQNLKAWHEEFVRPDPDLPTAKLFHPFMSDIIGNTICADLLDYLPRDRMNLGMEPRLHTRLQRYFTVRPGTLYSDEGLRASIMVTRKLRGGQRRDVATAVLDIMRERYEMAERVFYHHKKSSASAMLAKLVELAADKKPRDDEAIYPAPWDGKAADSKIPHMTHLSDAGLIEYLRNVETANPALQENLCKALRYRRKDMYRTLLIVDTELANSSKHSVEYFAHDIRGSDDGEINGRGKLEGALQNAAKGTDEASFEGHVIVYCPSPKMQSKEVDARLEIIEDRVLPLRVQRESFAYNNDLKVLHEYYQQLWRIYVFVTPRIYDSTTKSNAVVDAFCDYYGIQKALAYSKVRKHRFEIGRGVSARRALRAVEDYFGHLDYMSGAPASATLQLLSEASDDDDFLAKVADGREARPRLAALHRMSILRPVIDDNGKSRSVPKKQVASVRAYYSALKAGLLVASVPLRDRGSTEGQDYANFEKEVLGVAVEYDVKTAKKSDEQA